MFWSELRVDIVIRNISVFQRYAISRTAVVILGAYINPLCQTTLIESESDPQNGGNKGDDLWSSWTNLSFESFID
jgi:hypothetical protein